MQYFGRLDGLEGIQPRRLVQAIPYTLASGSRSEDDERLGVARYGSGFDAGADLKVGLSAGVILDATINPDFGQVEGDPAELNLTTFETFFSERRPFFLEGTQIFDDGFSRDGALVYTRRIGSEAPIVGATKLTGRTSRGLSFGALAAATGDDLDPRRLYGVGRVRQEIGSQNFVGGTFSVFDATADASTASGAGARSAVGAVDWQYRLPQDDAYQIEGVLAGSLRDGGDATDRGFGLYVGFDKIKGNRSFGSGLRIYSPGFRLNDVGRFRETDRVEVNGAIIRTWNQGRPFGPFRRLNTFVSSSAGWTYSDGTFRGVDSGLQSSGQLTGFQSVGISANVDNVGGYDVRETRGLGPIRNLVSGGLSASFSTDERRRFVAAFDASAGGDAEGGFRFGPEVEIEWAASDRVQFSASGEVEVARGLRAWAANEGLALGPDGRLFVGRESADPGEIASDDFVDTGLDASGAAALLDGMTPVDGPLALPGGVGYYAPLFGARDYRSADLTARANVIFQPNLSLQFYGQLFAARGRYRDFRLLASPEELRPFEAYPKRRDFSAASFLANAVLRWEYRPGSALYVVWQRAAADDLFEEVLLRDAAGSPYDVTAPGQFGDVLGAFADDVVLVKLSYLLMR